MAGVSEKEKRRESAAVAGLMIITIIMMIIIILGALWRFHRVVKKNQLLSSFLSFSLSLSLSLSLSRLRSDALPRVMHKKARRGMSFIGTIAERPRSGTCPAPPMQSRGCVFN